MQKKKELAGLGDLERQLAEREKRRKRFEDNEK
jgi:hypothetical protein